MTPTIRKFIALISICGMSLLAVQVLSAQSEAQASASEEATETLTLLDYWKLGGFAMYPLLFLSSAGIGLIIYNFLAIREQQFLKIGVLNEAESKATELDFEGACEILRANPSPVTNIALAGMERANLAAFDPSSISDAMEESSTEELAGPYVYVNYLSVIASLAPMVGLLGTVLGMIKAFQQIMQGGVGRPQEIAGNISEALITTATGMAVGIPAMFFYFFFKNKYGRIVSRVNRAIGQFHYDFVSGVREKA
ncbi:MAG: MotA/TolQ/ExbB proton channel family protein [Puniceicoccaceae bacterium]